VLLNTRENSEPSLCKKTSQTERLGIGL